MKPKKIPMRMCVGCRESKPKRELIRVVRAPDGTVSMDPGGKKPGRGAYVCRQESCLMRAIRQKQLERQLEVQLTDDVAEALRQELEDVQQAMNDCPIIRDMRDAQKKYQDMMDNVNRILRLVVTGETEDDKGGQPTSGCTGNCASCGGCH